MAYSESTITVERMLPYLKPLLDGGEVRWTAPGKARWLAYRIREALHVAHDNVERFPELAGAAEHYRIEVPSRDEVLAKLRPFVRVEVSALQGRRRAEAVAVEISSPEQIVQEWNREERTVEKLYFSSTSLGANELLQLYEWAQETGVLIFENLGAITLLLKSGNEDAAAYAWSPEDLEGWHDE